MISSAVRHGGLRAMGRAVAACAAVVLPCALVADPLVLAAASTNRAVDAAVAASGLDAVASYAASGVLARQIEQGAPADLFISANPAWMAHLAETGVIDAAQVAVLMSNTLVLIAPKGAPGWADVPLAARLEDGIFAMADPKTAPVGAYGEAALRSLGHWEALAPAFVPMGNTLATVAAVARGEAALGLVYASDASGHAVEVIHAIPPGSHPPIEYLVAPVAQGDDAAGGRALMRYLSGPDGAAILAAHGFAVTGAAP